MMHVIHPPFKVYGDDLQNDILVTVQMVRQRFSCNRFSELVLFYAKHDYQALISIKYKRQLNT